MTTIEEFREQAQAAFVAGYGETPLWWRDLVTDITSDGPSNTYKLMSELTQFVRIFNRTYTITGDVLVNIDGREVAELVSCVADAKLCGTMAARRTGIMIAHMLMANEPAYDGVSFFGAHEHNGHPYDNDVKGPISAETYLEACARMRALLGEDGKPIGVEPDVVLAASSARTIVTSAIVDAKRVITTDDLDVQPGTAYLLCANRGIMPFINQTMHKSTFDPTDFTVRGAGAVGFSLPFLAVRIGLPR